MELDSWSVLSILVKVLASAGSLLGAGSLLFLAALRPVEGLVAKRTVMLGLVSAVIAMIATGLQIATQAGFLMDDGVAGMADPDMLSLVADSPLGTSALVRVGGLVLVVMGLIFAPLRGISGVPGAILMAFSFALVGHATGDPRIALTLLITIHLTAVSFWVGALYPLHLGARVAPDATADIAHRFGRQASLIVPLLIFVGAAFIILRVEPLSALFATAYGFTLFAKIIVVALLLGLAALNKLRLVPAFNAHADGAAQRLRQSIRWEAFAFLAILAATAFLTTATTIPGPDM